MMVEELHASDASGDPAPRAEARSDAGRRVLPATGPEAALHGHLRLVDEIGGGVPWCGPAVLALATGRGYAEACEQLRRIAPAWYPKDAPVVTAYWRDLLAGLAEDGLAFAPLALPMSRPTLLQLVRGEALEPGGCYLVRVTDHFLLLEAHGFGVARLYDNRHTGAVVTGNTHGRRKVTHIVRLLDGPLAMGVHLPVAATD